jgi:hypothetical protein
MTKKAMATKKTAAKGSGMFWAKDGFNLSDTARNKRAIYNTVADNVGRSINHSELVKALFVSQTMSGNLKTANIYRNDALCWSLVDLYYRHEEHVIVGTIHNIIVESGLRNEVKRTLKTALQRAVTVISEGAKKLVIDDKKGSELFVELEDVVAESDTDKAVKGFVKALLASGATELTESMVADIKIALSKGVTNNSAPSTKAVKLPAISKKDIATIEREQFAMLNSMTLQKTA